MHVGVAGGSPCRASTQACAAHPRRPRKPGRSRRGAHTALRRAAAPRRRARATPAPAHAHVRDATAGFHGALWRPHSFGPRRPHGGGGSGGAHGVSARRPAEPPPDGRRARRGGGAAAGRAAAGAADDAPRTEGVGGGGRDAVGGLAGRGACAQVCLSTLARPPRHPCCLPQIHIASHPPAAPTHSSSSCSSSLAGEVRRGCVCTACCSMRGKNRSSGIWAIGTNAGSCRWRGRPPSVDMLAHPAVACMPKSGYGGAPSMRIPSAPQPCNCPGDNWPLMFLRAGGNSADVCMSSTLSARAFR